MQHNYSRIVTTPASPRRHRLLDAGIALALTVLVQLEVWSASSSDPEAFSEPWFSAPVLLFATVPMVLRRRAPVLVASSYGAALVVQVVGTGRFVASPGLFLSGMVLLYAAGRRGSRGEAIGATALAGLGIGVREAYSFPRNELDNWNAAVFYVLLLLAVAAGMLLRARAEAALARERSLQETAERIAYERAVQAERAQMAREMHDLVAHSVSAAVVQAEAAEIVMRTSPDRAEQSLRLIQETGREALGEMRRILGHLRDPANPSTSPQPGLAELPDLVERATVGQFQAVLEIVGAPRALGPGQELCLYRAVQESLSNARRHAGTPVQVVARLEFGDADVLLTVSDDGAGRAEESPDGHGLIGMRERVSLSGGTLSTGRSASGGFEVSVRLPYEPSPR